MQTYNFTQSNGGGFPINNSDSWHRIADIRVVNGTPTILEPDNMVDITRNPARDEAEDTFAEGMRMYKAYKK